MGATGGPRVGRRPFSIRAVLERCGVLAALGVMTSLVVGVSLAAARNAPSYATSRGGVRLVGPGGVSVVYPVDGQSPAHTMAFEHRGDDDFGVTFARVRLRPFPSFTPAGGPPPVAPTPEAAAWRWERAMLMPWVSGRKPWPVKAVDEHTSAKAAGWPLRCVWCELVARDVPAVGGGFNHVYTAPGGWTPANAVRPGWADWPPDYPLVIPLRPLWPELAANAAVWGAAWWVPLFGFGHLRRWRRRRRGACPWCAYDRRGLAIASACPECGSQGDVAGQSA